MPPRTRLAARMSDSKHDATPDYSPEIHLLSPNSIELQPLTHSDLPTNSLETIPSAHHKSLKDDYAAILLLVALYCLQGVPLGLTFGTLPFLLQAANYSYSAIGTFSLAVWPYSLKLLWSPFVDTHFLKNIGRRKSWILPTQTLIGLFMVFYANFIEEHITAHRTYLLTLLFFCLVVCVATQDIAVDGWAITLLSTENISYASTCQSIGQNLGYFLSYSVFLALNNKDFSNYFRSEPREDGLVTLKTYMLIWGFAYLGCTLYLALFKSEEPELLDTDAGQLYARLYRIVKLPTVMQLIAVLLTAKLAFVAADNVTILKLTEKGFPKEAMAMLVFFLFPFELIAPVLVGRWVKRFGALNVWIRGYPARMIMALISVAVVWSFPTVKSASELSWSFYARIVLIQIAYSFSVNILFVSQCAFYAQISDASIGGSYMTLLNTVSNLGGTWPKALVFYAVDLFTCKPAIINNEKPELNIPPDTCLILPIGTDGFYIVSFLCFLVGCVWYALMRQRVIQLGKKPKAEWICD